MLTVNLKLTTNLLHLGTPFTQKADLMLEETSTE